MTKIKIVTFFAAVLTLGAQTVSAQTIYPTYGYTGAATQVSNSCVNLTQNLSYGMRGDQVSTLQAFLVKQNFPGSGNWMITGYYGNATRAAVVDLQQQRGIAATGIADSATRAAIYSMSCGATIVAPISTSWNSYTNGNGYSYGNGYTYNNGYNYNNGYTNGVNLNLTSLSRNTGGTGDVVTVYGTGFDAYNNVVYLGTQAISAGSSNGTSITFTIPSYVTAGTVNLYVANSRGTSNSLSFVITSYSYTCGTYYPTNVYGSTYAGGYANCGCTTINTINPFNGGSVYPNCQNGGYVNNNTSAPTLSYLSPSNGTVGTSVTVFGSGFTTTNNSVRFGTAVIAGLYSADGHSVSFIVPSVLNGYGTQPIGLGSYPVSVTNSYGYTSNDGSFTVTSLLGNSSNALNVSYLSPTIGSVGTVVTIYGTGFTPDSIVHFGIGVVPTVSISNVIGSAQQAITFTVPSYIAPNCAAGVACPMYAQQVTVGSYPVSVVNINGTSNIVSFQVR